MLAYLLSVSLSLSLYRYIYALLYKIFTKEGCVGEETGPVVELETGTCLTSGCSHYFAGLSYYCY